MQYMNGGLVRLLRPSADLIQTEWNFVTHTSPTAYIQTMSTRLASFLQERSRSRVLLLGVGGGALLGVLGCGPAGSRIQDFVAVEIDHEVASDAARRALSTYLRAHSTLRS